MWPETMDAVQTLQDFLDENGYGVQLIVEITHPYLLPPRLDIYFPTDDPADETIAYVGYDDLQGALDVYHWMSGFVCAHNLRGD